MKIRSLGQVRIKDSDEGSVLILGIGLAIVVLILVTISVNVSVAWSRKLTLQNIADGAALSAVQGVDISSVYRGELNQGIRLNSNLVRNHVDKYLNQSGVHNQIKDLKLVRITISGARVKVVISSCLCLPFSYLSSDGNARIEISSDAIQILSK